MIPRPAAGYGGASLETTAPDREDVLWLVRAGVVDYDDSVALQERVRLSREQGAVPDVLLLLQHPPVITLGRGADDSHVLADPATLSARGIQLREAARGGEVTYHGPGQLVGYPIIDLSARGRDVHRYLRSLEEALILALGTLGIHGERIPGLTGVWVGGDKVAAIGVGVRRWITWHGFALNVSTELDAFELIVPCGIRDRGVTSVEQLLGRPVPEDEAVSAVIEGFGAALDVTVEERPLESLPQPIAASGNP